MPDKKSETEQLIITRYVCVGRRLTVKDKISTFFQKVLPDGTLGEKASWEKLGGVVGQVYEMKGTDEDTIFTKGPNSPRFLERWDNREDVESWQAQDRASYNEDQARKMEAKGGDELSEALEPLRKLAQRWPGRRSALLAVVISEIMKWR